jgi:ABC-type branched-subunit amino acid transport system substrate-binding protein
MVATSLAAAGCGGVASATGGGATAASCDTPGFTANEIKLGFVFPDSGPVGPSLAAARSGFVARIGQANAAGGIDGRKIVYSWADDQSSMSMNQLAVEDLVNNQHVFGLVEATVSAGGGEGFLRQNNIPVTGIPAEALWADQSNRNMFAYSYLFTSSPASVTTFGDYVKSQGGTLAATIDSTATPDATDVNAKISSSLAAAGIPTAPGTFVFNPNTTDPVQLGERLKAAHVDVVINSFTGSALAELVRGIREAGAPVKVILAPSGYDKSMLQQYGKALSGMTAAVAYIPFELGGPAHRAYLNAMNTYAPETQPPDQEIAFVTYILTDLFLSGLQKAGPCPTRIGYINKLRASTYTSGLLPGPVDMTKNFGQIANCYTFMQVNAAGTAYQPVPNPRATSAASRYQWCGQPIG